VQQRNLKKIKIKTPQSKKHHGKNKLQKSSYGTATGQKKLEIEFKVAVLLSKKSKTLSG